MYKMIFRLILFLSFLTSSSFGQKVVVKRPVTISRAEFDKHLPEIDLIIRSKASHKKNGILRLNAAKKTYSFKDDGEFLQYTYLGSLCNDAIAVIDVLEPNSEFYYLINKSNGKIDTLLNKPIFYTDYKSFICLEGSGTDVTQRIQIGEWDGRRILTYLYIKLAHEPFVSPSYVYWYNKHTLLIATNRPSSKDTKFYKIFF